MAQYKDFIPQNIAPYGVRRIGVYNEKGNRVGQIPLGFLSQKNTGQKLYSFGALSDIHIGENTANGDYVRALKWLSKNVNFICECGDLIHGNAENVATQIEQYIACRANATIPVYSIAGNHDGAYVTNVETSIANYTGQPLYYSFEQGNDVFIMVGVKSNGRTVPLFADGELQWLYETLEANRNKRCFVFQHVRPDDGCGNALEIYTNDIWGDITVDGVSYPEQTVFESLMNHYPNVILFHGHSHIKFDLQRYDDTANIARDFAGWSVHIPSLAVPRDTSSIVNPSIVNIYAASEGYVVDVYKNGIHLRGRDFVGDKFLPIASYWLDTTLKTIPKGTYWDYTGTIQTGYLYPHENVPIVYNIGYNVNTSTGELRAEEGFAVTDLIQLESGYQYTVYGSNLSTGSCSLYPQWYGENNTYIGVGHTNDGHGWKAQEANGNMSYVITPPNNATACRLQSYIGVNTTVVDKITVTRVKVN